VALQRFCDNSTLNIIMCNDNDDNNEFLFETNGDAAA